MVLVPGEEPFYFATGRVARFPVPFFDPTIDPYSPAEIASLVQSRNIRWLIVKRDLQTKEDPTPDRAALMDALYARVHAGGAFARVRCVSAVDKINHMNHNDHIDYYDLEFAMINEVSAVSFRQNLGEMLNQVQYRNDSIVINKDGKPVAALVDADLFARIRRMRDRFDELSGQVAAAYRDVPAELGMAEIDAAVAQERQR